MRVTVASCVLIGLLTSSCGTIGIRYLGIRPDALDTAPSTDITKWCETETGESRGKTFAGCVRFYQTVEWADHFVESYRSRATLNEWSIYAAGTVALGALATIGGLAVAGEAASQTAGFVSVGSGFTSGFFGFLDNKTRAGFYTQAANDIATARAEAVNEVMANRTEGKYWEQAGKLYVEVTKKVNWLETQRKEAAAKADVAAQIDQLNKRIDQLNSTLLSASIGQLVPANGKQGDTVTLMTPGSDLRPYKDSLKLLVGETSAEITQIELGSVRFKIPAKPIATQPTYEVRLRVGNMTIAPSGTEAPKLTYK